ncbi:MAG: exodeoxyribonuclease VII large subunit [Bacilli bacterium]|nr:exodeoxyribonuclease VII large subunit [Bacilli bacterium]
MTNNYITIGTLNKYLKNLFDGDSNLQEVYLKAEISNFKAHTRGHLYFTLKDETSRINAVMFSYNALRLKFKPVDGMKVLVKGKISVYEATGSYQIYVEEMDQDGLGNLYIEFEKLKKKLAAEGLFDPDKKKKIPKVPRKIGIVTASTGAAIKDILTTIKRRFPICETILFPSLVQGVDAAKDIVKNIEIANTYDIDTLIVGRGGGSIEDLWPFNEEIVARAIYDSKVPVISAVGHEIDFTIADFVADLRAPTPTAAAELAVPNIDTINTYLETVFNRSTISINNYIDNRKQILGSLVNSYVLKKPTAMYEIKEQNLDFLIDNLNKEIKKIIDNNKIRLYKTASSYVLTNPDIIYKFKMQNLEHIINKLDVLNPMNTLKRGYSIVKKDNKVISDIKNVCVDDMISVSIKNGNINAKVIEVNDGK